MIVEEGNTFTAEDAREKLPKLFESKTADGEDYWVVTSGAPVLAKFAEYAEDPSLYNAEDIEELRTVYEEAEEYIISQSDKEFDPKIVNIFMNVKEINLF